MSKCDRCNCDVGDNVKVWGDHATEQDCIDALLNKIERIEEAAVAARELADELACIPS